MSSDDTTNNKLLADHTYDGIQEYDNPMPRWWVNLFWATILFSVFYSAYYMTGFGPSHIDEYHQEMVLLVEKRNAQKEESPIDIGLSLGERLIAAARSEDSIKAGKLVFDIRCMACHGDKGQGLIGPNLTDDHWIHGGSMENILHITNVGVPAKGMIPWEGQLSEEERINVVAFIRSIQGTNVPGKPPEGEPSASTPLS